MPTILGRLTGVSFQTELLVMTFLGLVNSTFSWSFYDWTILVEKITNMPLHSKYFGEIVKTILRWVVIARIIIAHLYTVTFLANFYSILTWCRPKILLPWMIVSGFKNFFLEFVVIMVCLLLYFEREFSRGRLATFIVRKVLYLVPAIYYWRTVKAFFVELTEIQRRKSTRANLMTNTNGNTSRSLDIAERLRFRSTFAASFAYKQQRFMSLVNLDDLLFNSSFEINDERDYYKLTKSLATLITIDSQEFEEPEEDSRLQIIEDTTLTPVEKSMQILGLNRDDINDTRVRLGKHVLPNTSNVEEIEEIVSTIEPKENITSIDDRSTNEATKDLSIATETVVETSSPPLNVLPEYQSSLRETSKLSEVNPQQSCTCGKANEKSVDDRILDSRKNRKRSLISSSREAGNSGNEDEDDDDDSTKNVALPQPHRLSSKKHFKSEPKLVSSTERLSSNDISQSQLCNNRANVIGKSEENETMILPQQVKERRVTLGSLIIPGFEKKRIGWLKSSLLYPEDPKRMTVEIFRVDDISLEHDKQADDHSETSGSDTDTSRLHDLQIVPSLSKIDSNRHVVYTQTDLVNNAEEWKSDYSLDKAECSSSATKTSTSTQTNISDCWKNTIFQRSPNVSNNHDKHLFASKPSNDPPSLKETLFAGMSTFCKPKKRLETDEEREARYMRALRVYNRQTLVKYKREMDAKKQDAALENRMELQSPIFAANPTNSTAKDTREVSIAPQCGRIVNEKNKVKLDKIPKRQTRSRRHQQTSKLRTFNMGLDALEYSISLSFSNRNKNRSTPQVERSSEISSSTQQDGRKQFSKYSKPMRIPEGPSVSSWSIRRFEGLQKGRNLERTPGMENITGRSTTQEINRHIGNSRIETIESRLQNVPATTMFSSLDNVGHSTASVVETNDKPAIHDRHGISSLKETIKNIDWGFNEHRESVINDSLQEDNVISNNEDVLYDIIDDTDVISLLRSAFASNPENTERGFYLGPGSTVLYSVSNYLDNVVEEIMKTAKLSPNRDVFSTESTTEVDYGLSYLEEFQDTQSLALEVNDEETDSDNESSDGIKVEDLTSVTPAEFDCLDPIEMCCSSYSSEGLYTRNRQQLAIEEFDLANEKNQNTYNNVEEYAESLSSNNLYVSRGIADLLGDQEISYLEFWTNELKDLATYDHRNDMEFVQKFRHMTEMPGYCVVKTLVDFFRDFVAVSRSTMTSRMFLRGSAVSAPNSMQSEEIISNAFNERSNTSLINDTTIDSQNGTFIEVIDDDVAVSLRTLIDRMMESTEGNNPPNIVVVGIHDDRTTFPLREDQFYFGTPENTRRTINENLSLESKSELHDRDFICNEDIEAFSIAKQQTPPANTFEVCTIMNASPEVHNSEMVSSINPEGLFEIDSSVDSYDSFYSTGATQTSKPSDNAISIGGYSSFEDFAESPSNASGPLESQSPYTRNSPPRSENQ